MLMGVPALGYRCIKNFPLLLTSATAFRNKAETCRNLMRHVKSERTLRVLGQMIAENLAKAQEVEKLAVHEAPPLQPQ